jgi:uncharacterized Zn finger protein (UPF0148 family)
VLEKWVCPDLNCSYFKWQKEGETCPLCGKPVQRFTLEEYRKLYKSKKEIWEKLDTRSREEIKEKLEPKQEKDENKEDKELLITDEMTDEDIRKRIISDMKHLAMHEAGSGWMRASVLLFGDSKDKTLMDGFKALIDQNKIIIRQNELLLRAILREQKKESHDS